MLEGQESCRFAWRGGRADDFNFYRWAVEIFDPVSKLWVHAGLANTAQAWDRLHTSWKRAEHDFCRVTERDGPVLSVLRNSMESHGYARALVIERGRVTYREPYQRQGVQVL